MPLPSWVLGSKVWISTLIKLKAIVSSSCLLVKFLIATQLKSGHLPDRLKERIGNYFKTFFQVQQIHFTSHWIQHTWSLSTPWVVNALTRWDAQRGSPCPKDFCFIQTWSCKDGSKGPCRVLICLRSQQNMRCVFTKVASKIIRIELEKLEEGIPECWADASVGWILYTICTEDLHFTNRIRRISSILYAVSLHHLAGSTTVLGIGDVRDAPGMLVNRHRVL